MIRTDDNAPLHSKFQLAGMPAYGFWHAALSYCGRQLTDGFLAVRSLPTVFPSATPDERLAAIEALVREGCLHRVEPGQASPCGRRRASCPTRKFSDAGWILHDYFAYQERAASARLRRRMLSMAGRKGGEKAQQILRAEASGLGPSLPTPSVPIRSVPIRSTPEAATEALSGTPDAPSLNGHSNGHRRAEAKTLIGFLNAKTGRAYRLEGKAGEANVAIVTARLSDGASVEDCRGVIARKVREWLTDPKMSKFLRPETLFNRTKFASYVGEQGT